MEKKKKIHRGSSSAAVSTTTFYFKRLPTGSAYTGSNMRTLTGQPPSPSPLSRTTIIMKHRFDDFDRDTNTNACRMPLVDKLAKKLLQVDHPGSDDIVVRQN